MNADLVYSFNPASTAFSIDSANGDITVQTAGDLDMETTEVFYLSVEVRDDAATSADRLTYTYTVVIELTDVNEVKPMSVTYFINQPGLHTQHFTGKSQVICAIQAHIMNCCRLLKSKTSVRSLMISYKIFSPVPLSQT